MGKNYMNREKKRKEGKVKIICKNNKVVDSLIT